MRTLLCGLAKMIMHFIMYMHDNEINQEREMQDSSVSNEVNQPLGYLPGSMAKRAEVSGKPYILGIIFSKAYAVIQPYSSAAGKFPGKAEPHSMRPQIEGLANSNELYMHVKSDSA